VSLASSSTGPCAAQLTACQSGQVTSARLSESAAVIRGDTAAEAEAAKDCSGLIKYTTG
jgi:hypothetical protein